jgi:hypothetical protein
MMYAQADDGRLVLATPGGRGHCRLCGAVTIAKCGQVVVHHWAHEARAECDPWAEPDSKWHRWWQEFAPPGRSEVVMGPHRADIFTDDAWVVELQHSYLGVDEIAEREKFYGSKMAWLWDCTEAWRAGRLAIENERGTDWSGLPCSFRWKRPRKTLRVCKRVVFLDIGWGVLGVESMEIDRHGQMIGSGSLWDYRDFWRRLGYDPDPPDPPGT